MMMDSSDAIECLLNNSHALTLSLTQQSELIRILRYHKMLASFASTCIDNQVIGHFPEQVRRHLLNSLVIIERQNGQVKIEAERLLEVLKPCTDLVVFLKGAAYSIQENKVSKGRSYNDIDILVDKSNLKKIEQALILDAWVFQEINDYDDMYYRKWAHELPPMQHMIRGTSIDVHHNIIPVISKDAPRANDLKPFIEETSDGFQVFNNEFQFVHSAVHLFRNEDYEMAFRDLWDMRQMLKSSDKAFLDKVIRASKQIGFEYEIGLALMCLQHFFHMGLDESIIKNL